MNAHTRIPCRPVDPLVGATSIDGDLIVSRETLEKIGQGDAKDGRRKVRLMLAQETQPKIKTGPTPFPQNVRLATARDAPEIYELAMRDLRENGAPIAPVNPAKVAGAINKCLQPGRGFVGVIEDGPNREIVAMAILLLDQWWWSDRTFIQDMLMYVHPDHRKSHHIDDLHLFAKWAAEAMTAQSNHTIYLLAAVLGLNRVHAKMALFKRKFTQVGMTFLYPPPPGDGR